MRILGIETSCDETSAAVLEDGWRLRSNVVASQVELHAPFGGVVPEIASRRHVELITLVIQQALDEAAGEAFDKGARLLGLGNGGGAALNRAAEGGDPRAIPFPRARTEPPLDF